MKRTLTLVLTLLVFGCSLSAQVFINRDVSITSAEVFGMTRAIPADPFSSKFGGMYIETTNSSIGKPFYGYAMDGGIKAYSYFDGANSGLHQYLGGTRESIWPDSMRWITADGVRFQYEGHRLVMGKEGNLVIGYSSVPMDSENNIGNTILGTLAAQDLVSGVSNTVVGFWGGWHLATGDYNTLLGTYSGSSLTSGSRNTILGYYAGASTGGSSTGNVFLGYQAGRFETGSNKLYISNSSTSSPLIYGDFTTNSVEINGSTELDGNTTINGTATINGVMNLSNQLTTQDIKIDDSNPYLEFRQLGTSKYYFQYQNGNDQFVLHESGNGQILKIKNGEIYFPQHTGSEERNLRIGADGRLIVEDDSPNPYTYTGWDLALVGSSTTAYPVKDLKDGITLSSLAGVITCSSGSVSDLEFLRKNKTTGIPQTIYELSPPSNGCGTFSTSTVQTSGANVIDTDNYYYYFRSNASVSGWYIEIRLNY